MTGTQMTQTETDERRLLLINHLCESETVSVICVPVIQLKTYYQPYEYVFE